jgi:peptide/nickel transport system permease protein
MRYIANRIAISALTILIASSLVFFALRLLPGDPVLMLLGESGSAQPGVIEEMRVRLGMDGPLYAQYGRWLAQLARLDFGTSVLTGQPIADELLRRLPRSLELMAGGLAVSIGIGIPAGVIAARNQGWPGTLASTAALAALSAPTFVKGLLLVIVFSVTLRWLPSSGYVAFAASPRANLEAALLPALTLGLGFAGVVQRVTRASLLETLHKDYVRTARAAGLSERAAVYRHALPNAMIPVLSVVGMRIGSMLGGMVVIESLFNWPGLSSYLIEACYGRDYPAILSTLVVIFAIFALVSLAVDLLMAVLDPRRRHG